jgi:hypothetical protein
MKPLIALLLLTLAATVTAADKSAFTVAPAGPGGARELTLAPDLSFTDDSSANYPIRGKDLSDGRIASDRPTAVFFGTSHCWNTNREAERFVALYAKEKDAVRFIVVDLEHPSRDQKLLVSKLYAGFIPTVAFVDRTGKVVYDRAGETSGKRGDSSRLEALLEEARR